MNIRYALILLSGLALLLTACGLPAGAAQEPGATVIPSAETPWPSTPPESCPITQPPAEPFIPPGHGAYPYEGHMWYGTPALWTDIPADGTWSSLPNTEGRGYTQKVVFWNEFYDWQTEQNPALTLSGQRLDGDAPTFETDHATNGYHPDVGPFILIGVEIPTLGCWELTGHYRDTELSYVVWVAP